MDTLPKNILINRSQCYPSEQDWLGLPVASRPSPACSETELAAQNFCKSDALLITDQQCPRWELNAVFKTPVFFQKSPTWWVLLSNEFCWVLCGYYLCERQLPLLCSVKTSTLEYRVMFYYWHALKLQTVKHVTAEYNAISFEVALVGF